MTSIVLVEEFRHNQTAGDVATENPDTLPRGAFTGTVGGLSMLAPLRTLACQFAQPREVLGIGFRPVLTGAERPGTVRARQPVMGRMMAFATRYDVSVQVAS